MSESKPLNIYQKINTVMKAVSYVKKDTRVTAPGANYSAVTHDEITAVLREHLVSNGIVVVPEQTLGQIVVRRDPNNGIKMHLFEGCFDVHFINIDDPADKVTVTVFAHANDNGDKAPGKCMSYAVKSAMLKLFSLETGENEESRHPQYEEPELITAEQSEQIKKALTDNAVLDSDFLTAAQVQSIDQIHSDRFNGAIGWIKKQAAKDD